MAERVETHLRESDAFSWYLEDDALLRSTIVAVVKLAAAPDWDRLVARVDRATRLVPTFRDRIVDAPLRISTPQWVPDTNFDLSFHLRRVGVPAPHTFDEILRYARIAAMAGFDRARPLWEFTLLEGLADGGAALVMKVHHSLSDGIGGMQLALLLFDLDPTAEPADLDPSPFASDVARDDGSDVLSRVRDSVGHDLRQVLGFAQRHATSAVPSLLHSALHPVETVTNAIAMATSIGRIVAPVSETLSPLMRERTLSWHFQVLDLPLAQFQRAAKTAGGTLNDVFLAGVVGGLQNYHLLHHKPVPELRMTMPISVRKDTDPEGGNRITLMRFKVPTTIADPVERMRVLHRLVSRSRSEPGIRHSNSIAGVLNLLPRETVGAMLKHVDFLASNVPGVPVPMYLAGVRVERYFPFGPTSGAAVNITLLSYLDSCGIGINTDTGAIPDSDSFRACIESGFAEVLATGGPTGRESVKRMENPTKTQRKAVN